MWPVNDDFAAEGLLDSVEDGRDREARLALLTELREAGVPMDELRRAVSENRLALLPVEMVLDDPGPRRRQREVAEKLGLSLEFMAEARRAVGLPAVDPDDPVITEAEVELANNAAMLLAAGISTENFLDLTRVMSHSMANVASVLVTTVGEAMLRPGDTERDLGLRYAEALRHLGPLAGPSLTMMLNLRMREQLGQAVVGRAERQSGQLPGGVGVNVAFVDIVGFTRLGEEVGPDDLTAVVRRFEHAAEDVARPPVRLVKTIGDAAMLVSPEAPPLLDAVLQLVEGDHDDGSPMLRGGVAAGQALPRAGDWYGRPVNLAARLTAFARRGSVVTSEEVHDSAADRYTWSFAGSRRFKGVTGEVAVFRVRRPQVPPPD